MQPECQNVFAAKRGLMRAALDFVQNRAPPCPVPEGNVKNLCQETSAEVQELQQVVFMEIS
jgi:hypothetical protein